MCLNIVIVCPNTAHTHHEIRYTLCNHTQVHPKFFLFEKSSIILLSAVEIASTQFHVIKLYHFWVLGSHSHPLARLSHEHEIPVR